MHDIFQPTTQSENQTKFKKIKSKFGFCGYLNFRIPTKIYIINKFSNSVGFDNLSRGMEQQVDFCGAKSNVNSSGLEPKSPKSFCGAFFKKRPLPPHMAPIFLHVKSKFENDSNNKKANRLRCLGE